MAFLIVPDPHPNRQLTQKFYTIMNKNNQLNEKAQYAAPSCKSVVLEASASMMNVTSPGQAGYGRSGEAGQDGEYDGTDRWNF